MNTAQDVILRYELEVESVQSGSEEVPSRDGRLRRVATPSAAETQLRLWPIGWNKLYRLRVRAVGEGGPGQWSGTILVRSGLAVPPPPDGLRASCVTPAESGAEGSRLRLEWLPPACDGGSPCLGYRVYWQALVVDTLPLLSTVTKCRMVGAQAHQCIVGGLWSNQCYTLWATCVNEVGESEPSERVSAWTVRTRPGPPSAPRPTPQGPDMCSVSWLGPEDDGGAPILSYRVAATLCSAGAPEVVSVIAPCVASSRPRGVASAFTECFTVAGLRVDAAYAFRVQAISSLGDGSLSEASEPVRTGPAELPSFCEPADAGGASFALEPPGAPEAREAGVPTRAVLSWREALDAGGAPVSHYRVAVREVEGDCSIVRHGEWALEECVVSGTTYTVTGLVAGGTYQFAVAAVTAAGESELSAPSAPYCAGPRPPGPPGRAWLYGPAAMAPHDPLLAFAAPQRRPGDAPIECFRAVAFVEGRLELTAEVPLTVISTDGHVVTAAVSTLQGNQACQFAVQAFGPGGWGPLGPASSAAFVWRPVAPGCLRATRVEPTGVELTWEATVDQTGRMITSYSVEFWCEEEGEEERAIPQQLVKAAGKDGEGALGTVVSADVSGLRPGLYLIYVYVFHLSKDNHFYYLEMHK